MVSTSPLQKAVEIAGGQRHLAKAIGVPPTTLAYWLRGSRRGVPAEHAIAIEAATFGAVAREELRPDIFAIERSRRRRPKDCAA